jgi:hypothetical protein
MASIQCSKCGQEKEIRFFSIIPSDDPRWVWGAFQFEPECNDCRDPLDKDIYPMTMLELRKEIKKLRAAIRTHRDAKGQNLCWYVPELWGTLPEKVEPEPEPPPVDEFIAACRLYRNSLK